MTKCRCDIRELVLEKLSQKKYQFSISKKRTENSAAYALQRRTICCCLSNDNNQFEAININMNARNVNEMTHFDLALQCILGNY